MKTRLVILISVAIVSLIAISILYIPLAEVDLNFYNAQNEMRRTEQINKSPYAVFGDSSQTLMTSYERTSNHMLEVTNRFKNENIGRFELNTQTGKAKLFDRKGNLLSETLLQPDQLTRFMTMDRFAEKYYDFSPYQYAANNPIKYIDFNGDSIWVSTSTTVTNADGTTSTQTKRYYYGQDADGNYGFIDPASGSLYSGSEKFVGQVADALGKLREGSVGKGLVDELMNSKNSTTIVSYGRNTADMEKGKTIYWNSNNKDGGPTQNGNTTRDPFIGLGHEMAHVQDVWRGTIDNSTWQTVTKIDGTIKAIPKGDIYATHMENQLRAEHNLTLRVAYGIDANGNPDESTRIIRAGTSESIYFDAMGNNRFMYQPIPIPWSTFNY